MAKAGAAKLRSGCFQLPLKPSFALYLHVASLVAPDVARTTSLYNNNNNSLPAIQQRAQQVLQSGTAKRPKALINKAQKNHGWSVELLRWLLSLSLSLRLFLSTICLHLSRTKSPIELLQMPAQRIPDQERSWIVTDSSRSKRACESLRAANPSSEQDLAAQYKSRSPRWQSKQVSSLNHQHCQLKLQIRIALLNQQTYRLRSGHVCRLGLLI